MTRAQAIRSVETGIALANERADHGDRCILPGEMGISNTTSSAAIVAALLELTPEEVTGRGANISDRRLAHKIEIVRRALTVNAPDPHDGLDVLAKVGGFELGCIAGLILGAAARRMLIVLDGANTTSAALIAHALAPNCVHYLLASHASLTDIRATERICDGSMSIPAGQPGKTDSQPWLSRTDCRAACRDYRP